MPQEMHKPVTPYKVKKGENYMNSKQLKHFRVMLEGIKLGLGQDIDRTVHTMQDEATIFSVPFEFRLVRACICERAQAL